MCTVWESKNDKLSGCFNGQHTKSEGLIEMKPSQKTVHINLKTDIFRHQFGNIYLAKQIIETDSFGFGMKLTVYRSDFHPTIKIHRFGQR